MATVTAPHHSILPQGQPVADLGCRVAGDSVPSARALTRRPSDKAVWVRHLCSCGCWGARGTSRPGDSRAFPATFRRKTKAREGEGRDLLCPGPSLRCRAACTSSVRCRRVLAVKGSKVQADSSMDVSATCGARGVPHDCDWKRGKISDPRVPVPNLQLRHPRGSSVKTGQWQGESALYAPFHADNSPPQLGVLGASDQVGAGA